MGRLLQAYNKYMSDLTQLIRELNDMVADSGTPAEVHASRIVDDLLIRYADIYQSDPTFRAIGDMAIKINSSRASEGEDGVMWSEVMHQVQILNDK